MNLSNRGLEMALMRIIFFSFVIFLSFAFFAMPGSANAAGASLGIYPSSGSYAVGSQISLSLVVSSPTAAINAAEGVIRFDPSMVEAISVSKVGSIFSLWTTEPVFDNVAGTITFAGGGQQVFLGSSGKIIGINFRAKSAGNATISIISSAVLAADGIGTNVLNAASGGSYAIKARVHAEMPIIETQKNQSWQPAETEAETTTGSKPGVILISSSSHPDADKWYSINDLAVAWTAPDEAISLAMGVDQNANTSPEKIYPASVATKTVENLPDGTWYFHLQAKNASGWGEVSHRKVLVDTTPPDEIAVSVDNNNDPTNPTPKLVMGGKDSVSGIDHFEISIGGREFRQVPADGAGGATYVLPVTEPGDHLIFLKAVDKADNYKIIQSSLAIEPIAAPILSDIKTTSSIGEPLLIHGSTNYPGSKVVITFKKSDGTSIIAEQLTDSRGYWTFVQKDNVCLGTYTVSAHVIDARGAESAESSLVAFEIVGSDKPVRVRSTSFELALICFLAGVLLCLIVLFVILYQRQIRSKTLSFGSKIRKRLKKVLRD